MKENGDPLKLGNGEWGITFLHSLIFLRPGFINSNLRSLKY
jgi:hypothetical protein